MGALLGGGSFVAVCAGTGFGVFLRVSEQQFNNPGFWVSGFPL